MQSVSCVGFNHFPRAFRAIGPYHAYFGIFGSARAHMRPTKLAAGMTCADEDLTAGNFVSNFHLEPGTNGINIGCGLCEFHIQPIAAIFGGAGILGAYFSSRLTHLVSSGILLLLFALLMLVVGALMVLIGSFWIKKISELDV